MTIRALPAPRIFSPDRIMRALAIALLSAAAVVWLMQHAAGPNLLDIEWYWGAAERLRAGEPLYPPQRAVFRYAPWFAWAWVPLTYLPRELVSWTWFGANAAAGVYLAWPFRRSLALFLLGPAILESVFVGNVQALMVAGLLFGVERRSGPLWIALAASLKITPLAFALVYAGRREWGRFGLTIGATALLWLPLAWSGIGDYPAGGEAIGHARYPVLFVGLVVLAAAATLLLARTRYAWLAAASLAVVATPRLFPYQIVQLAVSAAALRRTARVHPELQVEGRAQ